MKNFFTGKVSVTFHSEATETLICIFLFYFKARRSHFPVLGMKTRPWKFHSHCVTVNCFEIMNTQCVQSAELDGLRTKTQCVDNDPQRFDNETKCIDNEAQRIKIVTQCVDNEMQRIYNALTTSCNAFSGHNAFALTFLMAGFRK